MLSFFLEQVQVQLLSDSLNFFNVLNKYICVIEIIYGFINYREMIIVKYELI